MNPEIPSKHRTSFLAVFSLVLAAMAVLCVVMISIYGLVLSIPAIVLGHQAKAHCKADPGTKENRVAQAGLIIGYTTILVSLALFVMSGTVQV